MALVTCYDPQGVAHQKEPVDARECVAQCGYSMTPAADAPDEPVVQADAPKRRARQSKTEVTDVTDR